MRRADLLRSTSRSRDDLLTSGYPPGLDDRGWRPGSIPRGARQFPRRSPACSYAGRPRPYSGQWYAISAVNGNLSRIDRRRRTTRAARTAGASSSGPASMPAADESPLPGRELHRGPGPAPGRLPVRAARGRRGSSGLLPARLLPAICKSTIRIYDHHCRLCPARGLRHAACEHDAYRTGAVQECMPVRVSVTDTKS